MSPSGHSLLMRPAPALHQVRNGLKSGRCRQGDKTKTVAGGAPNGSRSCRRIPWHTFTSPRSSARELQALGHTVCLMPPAYVKPYVKRHKNDATDAEAICEAVTRPNMRFVATKTPEQQNCLTLHRTRHLFIRQQVLMILRGPTLARLYPPCDSARGSRARHQGEHPAPPPILNRCCLGSASKNGVVCSLLG